MEKDTFDLLKSYIKKDTQENIPLDIILKKISSIKSISGNEVFLLYQYALSQVEHAEKIDPDNHLIRSEFQVLLEKPLEEVNLKNWINQFFKTNKGRISLSEMMLLYNMGTFTTSKKRGINLLAGRSNPHQLNNLIEEYLYLVKKVLHQMGYKESNTLYQDYYQNGCEGLIRGLKQIPSFYSKEELISYLKTSIKNAIINGLPQEFVIPISHQQNTKLFRLSQWLKDFKKQNGREASYEDAKQQFPTLNYSTYVSALSYKGYTDKVDVELDTFISDPSFEEATVNFVTLKNWIKDTLSLSEIQILENEYKSSVLSEILSESSSDIETEGEISKKQIESILKKLQTSAKEKNLSLHTFFS